MVQLLINYKYILLFPLSIIEGPIITVIAGFVSSLGLMNWLLIYIIVIAGDIVGDTIMYAFGRYGGGFLKKHGFRVGATPERLEAAKEYFANHHHKAIITSKIFHGVGVSGLIAAGALKISYARFIKTCGAISLVQSAILLILGIFFGHAYQQIGQYFDTYAAVISVTVLIIIAGFIFFKFKNSGTKLS
jgi:membrane protein DedA with SNARE-associated domain